MNCKKCGNPLNENEQYCKVCGEPVLPQANTEQNINNQPVQSEANQSVNNMVNQESTINSQPEVNQSTNNMINQDTIINPQPEVTPTVNTMGATPSVTEPEVMQPVSNMINQDTIINPQPEVMQPVNNMVNQESTINSQPEVAPVVNTVETPNVTQPAFNPLGGSSNSTIGQTSNFNNNSNKPEKKSKSPLLIIIVAAILIGIGIALFFVLKPNDKSSSSKETKKETKDVIDDATEDVIDDDTETTDGEYDIPSYFKLKFTVPDKFKLDQTKQDPSTKDIYYIFKNTEQTGYLYSLGLMRLNTPQSSLTVANSLREGFIEQLKEETNNVSDLKYEKGSLKTKTINGKSWTEFIDTATSSSLNAKVTAFMYIIDYENATYIAYGVIAGDMSAAEPTLSTFLNSLKF